MNDVLARMIALMASKHAGQKDKAGRPYILHPIAVMNMLSADYPDDYELMSIGVGHDGPEDTKTTYKEMYDIGCSDRIVNGIKAMTRLPGQTEEEYQAQVLFNSDAIKVKMKDIIHNSDIRRLKGLTEKDFARAQKYQKFFVILREANERK